jgi:Tannase and feruloyl esterase
MTFALASLAALALPLALHAAPTEHGRRVRAAVDCAAALRIALPDVHITAARAVPSNDSLRALGEKPYCRVEATVDAETHIVALLPDHWNGRFLMGGGGGYGGSVDNQYESMVHEGYATAGADADAGHTAMPLLAGWAWRNDRRIADYEHRAVHRTAEATKALIAAYCARPPEHSYFIGCFRTAGASLVCGRLRPQLKRAPLGRHISPLPEADG